MRMMMMMTVRMLGRWLGWHAPSWASLSLCRTVSGHDGHARRSGPRPVETPLLAAGYCRIVLPGPWSLRLPRQLYPEHLRRHRTAHVFSQCDACVQWIWLLWWAEIILYSYFPCSPCADSCMSRRIYDEKLKTNLHSDIKLSRNAAILTTTMGTYDRQIWWKCLPRETW